MAFAAAQFELNSVQEDGGTLRDHLNMAFQFSGIRPQELEDETPLPALAAYLWAWFCELHSARGSNGFGPSSLSWRDLLDWAAVTGNKPHPWEVRAIRAIDRAFLVQAGKDSKKASK